METWKPIIGYEGYYNISDSGKIRRDRTGRILKNIVASDGYLVICLHKNGVQKNHYVHLLVAKAFLGKKPDGFQCNHKDGKKDNPRVSNLEYITRDENSIHAFKHGLLRIYHGSSHRSSKLTEQQVTEIREKFNQGDITQRKLAKIYRISYATLSRIINRINWRHI